VTPDRRGDLIEALWPAAAHLVCLVHGDGGQRDIHQALTRLTPAEKDALLVMLAALVDPDDRPDDLLHWITWDEHGHPTRPETGDPRSLRRINHDSDTEAEPPPTPRRQVIVDVTRELAAQGLSRTDIARRLGVTWSAVTQAHSRTRTPLPKVGG
jgi:hypothetical protein